MSTVHRPDLQIGYVAHPLSGRTAEADRGEVAENLKRALRWLAFLVDQFPTVIFECSWMAYAAALDNTNPVHRARGLGDTLKKVALCDKLFLTGGRISNGMQQEIEVAEANGLWVYDLTPLGAEPTFEPKEHVFGAGPVVLRWDQTGPRRMTVTRFGAMP